MSINQTNSADDAVKTMVEVSPTLKIHKEKDRSKVTNLYKFLYNYLKKFETEVPIKPLKEDEFVSISLTRLQREIDLLKMTIKISSSNKEVIMEEKNENEYFSEEVAKFFNTTIQSIQNWIQSGRIKGVEKVTERFQKVKISENATYKTSSGDWVPIKEFARIYYQQSTKLRLKANTDDVLSELIENLHFFQNKYNSTFEEKFGDVNLYTLSSEERSHAIEWKFLTDEISRRNNVK